MSINHKALLKKVLLLLKYTGLSPQPPREHKCTHINLNSTHFQYMTLHTLHDHLLLHDPDQEFALPPGCSCPVALSGHQGCHISGFSQHLYLWHILPHNLWFTIQIRIPCVTHFVYVPQQHIARISKANSAQIPCRICYCWQKPMLPEVFEKSAELDTVHAPFHMWTDYQLLLCLLLWTNLSAFHHIFNCLVKNIPNCSFQFAPCHSLFCIQRSASPAQNVHCFLHSVVSVLLGKLCIIFY